MSILLRIQPLIFTMHVHQWIILFLSIYPLQWKVTDFYLMKNPFLQLLCCQFLYNVIYRFLKTEIYYLLFYILCLLRFIQVLIKCLIHNIYRRYCSNVFNLCFRYVLILVWVLTLRNFSKKSFFIIIFLIPSFYYK